MRLGYLSTVLCVLGFSGSAIAATEGTINFTGEVINSSCEVDDSIANQTIALPSIPKTALKAANATAGEKAFTLKFKNCAAGNVAAVFSPSLNTGFLNGAHVKNTASGTGENAPATGVDIALYNENGEKIDLSVVDAKTQSITPTPIVEQTGGEVTINLVAKYIATKASITPGKVAGTLKYQIQYL